MTINTYEGLREHVGHKIECAAYGIMGKAPANVAVECVTCHVTITEFDRGDE